MPGPDGSHWLHRFSAEEWLRAAETELARAESALRARQQRAGVAGARRAAGMAWNAVLAGAPDEAYGRSYMEHLKALGADPSVPESVREAGARLLAAPLANPLITLGGLGPGDTSLARDAGLILEHARTRVTPRARA